MMPVRIERLPLWACSSEYLAQYSVFGISQSEFFSNPLFLIRSEQPGGVLVGVGETVPVGVTVRVGVTVAE